MNILKDRNIVAILILGLLLRLVLLGMIVVQDNVDLLHEGDTGSYKTLAQGILEGDFLFSEEPSRTMSYLRTPGYPLVLALVYSAGGDDYAIAFFQILFEVGAIYLIYKLGEQIGGAGWQAALLYAVSRLFISFSFKLVSESFFIFVFLLINWLFFKNIDGEDKRQLLIVGLLFGILILIRPVATPFPVFYAMAHYWKKRNWKDAAYLIIPAYLLVGVWVLRNVLVLNELSLTRIGAMSYACWTGPLLANDENVDITPWQ